MTSRSPTPHPILRIIQVLQASRADAVEAPRAAATKPNANVKGKARANQAAAAAAPHQVIDGKARCNTNRKSKDANQGLRGNF